MSAGSLDPEIIAAFLDGTLQGSERERVTRVLVSTPELYELMVEAAAVRAEVPPAPVVPEPIPTPWWRRRWLPEFKVGLWPVAVPVAVAALAGFLLVPRIVFGGPDALRLFAVPSWQQPGVLGPDWNLVQWPAARTALPSSVPTNVAFRAGVLQVNLEVAARLKDSARTATSATELSDVLGNVEDGGPVAALAAGATSAPERRKLARTLQQLFADSPWYELGLWAGQARVAVAAGDISFFAPDARASEALLGVHNRLAADSTISSDSNSEATLKQIKAFLAQINAGQFSNAGQLSASLEPIVIAASSVR